MGHGTSSGSVATNYYYVAIRDLKTDPKFSIRRKVGSEYVEENARFISGYIQDAKVEDNEITIQGKKRKVKEINIRLYDPASRSAYILKSLFSQVSRELINRLASADTLKHEIKLTLWKDDQGYAKMSVRKQNPLGEWDILKNKYSYKDDLAKYIKEVTVNGDTVKDYSSLDAALTKVLDKINTLEKLESRQEPKNELGIEAPTEEPKSKPDPTAYVSDENDDLPF